MWTWYYPFHRFLFRWVVRSSAILLLIISITSSTYLFHILGRQVIGALATASCSSHYMYIQVCYYGGWLENPWLYRNFVGNFSIKEEIDCGECKRRNSINRDGGNHFLSAIYDHATSHQNSTTYGRVSRDWPEVGSFSLKKCNTKRRKRYVYPLDLILWIYLNYLPVSFVEDNISSFVFLVGWFCNIFHRVKLTKQIYVLFQYYTLKWSGYLHLLGLGRPFFVCCKVQIKNLVVLQRNLWEWMPAYVNWYKRVFFAKKAIISPCEIWK